MMMGVTRPVILFVFWLIGWFGGFSFFQYQRKPHWEENLSSSPLGCDVVLDWLRKTYWSRQLGNNLCGESEDEDEQEEVEENAELDNDEWEIQAPQHEACQKHKEFHGRHP